MFDPGQKMPRGKEARWVTQSLWDAAVILALRESVDYELVGKHAHVRATRGVHTLASKEAEARGVGVEEWVKDRARQQAFEEAVRRAKVFNGRHHYGRNESVPDRMVQLTLQVKTHGVARMSATMNGHAVLDAPLECMQDPEQLRADDVHVSGSRRVVLADRQNVDDGGALPCRDLHKSTQQAHLVGSEEGDARSRSNGSVGQSLNSLELWMYEQRRCAACHSQPAYISDDFAEEPMDVAERYRLVPLQTRWAAGSDLGHQDESGSHEVGEPNLRIDKEVLPELSEWRPGVEKANAELVNDLQAAVRASTLRSHTLLHVATSLGGMSKGNRLECACFAARRARVLGVLRHLLDDRDRRRAASAQPRSAQSELSQPELSRPELSRPTLTQMLPRTLRASHRMISHWKSGPWSSCIRADWRSQGCGRRWGRMTRTSLL